MTIAAWTVSLFLGATTVTAFADDNTSVVNHQVESSAETIVSNPDLASSLGLGEDVHFSAPRNFRVSVFNDEHVDVEPSAGSTND